uniref:Uncharacterized protein n=1 Tax=Niveomyces insectorum TaxID=150359 RepID=A0A6B9DET9_9HYPO|nr:hypothetical protein [Niveomyces insectorum]
MILTKLNSNQINYTNRSNFSTSTRLYKIDATGLTFSQKSILASNISTGPDIPFRLNDLYSLGRLLGQEVPITQNDFVGIPDLRSTLTISATSNEAINMTSRVTHLNNYELLAIITALAIVGFGVIAITARLRRLTRIVENAVTEETPPWDIRNQTNGLERDILDEFSLLTDRIDEAALSLARYIQVQEHSNLDMIPRSTIATINELQPQWNEMLRALGENLASNNTITFLGRENQLYLYQNWMQILTESMQEFLVQYEIFLDFLFF